MIEMWRLLRPDSLSVAGEAGARQSLGRYFDVMEDRKLAKFIIARRLEAETFGDAATEGELWGEHRRLADQYAAVEREVDSGALKLSELGSPSWSFLDLKAELGHRILAGCRLCIRGCGADRLAGKAGYCRCGEQIEVSSIFKHIGEEPELVPSGTVFTMGCTLTCRHCQNWGISQWAERGKAYTAEGLAREVDGLRAAGCRNANLVGGDPTPWLPQWMDVFRHVSLNVPVVWNSNSYYSEESARLLSGFADVYLLDFKYGPGDCAERISDSPGYWEASKRNHLMAKACGELIVRVLVLPGHLECCTRPIIEWIATNLGAGTRVNLMFQYRPEWRARELPELGRRLTDAEKRRAIQLADASGLSNYIV